MSDWRILKLPKYFLGMRKPKTVLVYLPAVYEGWGIQVPSKLIREFDDSFTLALKADFSFTAEKIEVSDTGTYVVTGRTIISGATVESLFQGIVEDENEVC